MLQPSPIGKGVVQFNRLLTDGDFRRVADCPGAAKVRVRFVPKGDVALGEGRRIDRGYIVGEHVVQVGEAVLLVRS
jgi:hypothetical protein